MINSRPKVNLQFSCSNSKLTFCFSVEELKEKLLKEIEEKGIEASKNDPSIYTGLCGIALLHYKMNGERGKVNDKVFELIRMAENPNRHRITFLCGMAGPLSILYKVKRRHIASITTLKYVISRLCVE